MSREDAGALQMVAPALTDLTFSWDTIQECLVFRELRFLGSKSMDFGIK